MKQTLEELMEHCVQYFEQQSFSVGRIERYNYVWKKKLLPYMINQSIPYYNVSVGQSFLDSKFAGETITPYERDLVRCIHVLDEFQEKGIISKRYYKPVKLELSGSIGTAMEKFLSHLELLRRSKITISGHRMCLYALLTYLESKRVQTIGNFAFMAPT